MPWSSVAMKLIGKTSAAKKVRFVTSASETSRKSRRMAGSRNYCVFGRFVAATE